jgi:hypothetical protein
MFKTPRLVTYPEIVKGITREKAFTLKTAIVTSIPIDDIPTPNAPDSPSSAFFRLMQKGVGIFCLATGCHSQVWCDATRAAISLGAGKMLFIGSGQALRKASEHAGCVVLDHINLSGDNPLLGKNDDTFGPRFPDMSALYNPKFAQTILRAGVKNGFRFQAGTLLIPRWAGSLSALEKKVLQDEEILVSSAEVYAGAITAAHASRQTGALLLYPTLKRLPFIGFLDQLL